MSVKYITPFTRFGFKRIFGEEASRPLLIDFLNALLPESDKIVKLTEPPADSRIEQKAAFDFYCENERGEKFIAEMQTNSHDFFRDPGVYRSSFPILEQAEAGPAWEQNLKGVYCIGILNFAFDNCYSGEEDQGVHIIELNNQRGKAFCGKLTYIYLELPKFKKEENQLVTRLDKWIYFIKHLEDFQSAPALFKKEEVFAQAFAKAEIAELRVKEFYAYEMSLKTIRDIEGVLDYARKEGIKKGRMKAKMEAKKEAKMEAKMEIAMNMIREGDTAEKITRCTELDKETIEELRNKGHYSL